MSARIRPEVPDDADAVRAVHLAAFSTSAEADLVLSLNADGTTAISLVAEEEGQVIGHVLLSRMTVHGDGREYRALGLAPVAVVPHAQRKGVGSKLIEEALSRAEKQGEELVFVLGEPAYYRRFGFDPNNAAPFASPYAGPYLMAKSFHAPLPASGTADYAAAFAELG